MIMVLLWQIVECKRDMEREIEREREGVICFSPWHTLFVCVCVARPTASCQLNCPSSRLLALPALLSPLSLSVSVSVVFCCANDTCVLDSNLHLDLFVLSLHTLRRLTRLARISFGATRCPSTSVRLSVSLLPFAVSSCSLSLNVLCF